MSLDYNIIETIKLLKDCFKYEIFISIIISCILFVILLIINKDKKITKYIVLGLNIILVIIIGYYYIKDIIKFNFSNPINNIYFCFFNTIIYLIISSITNFKTKYKKINYIFYGLCLINILFSLFMTHYLDNNTLLVIGNIFPMIKFGNIIYIGYYVFVLVSLGRYLWEKKN